MEQMSTSLPTHNSLYGLLLAAGNSSRLGRPKQQLIIGEVPLLSHTVSVMLESGIGKLLVVLGAFAEENERLLESFPVEIIQNKDWQKGMGSSIKLGLSHLIPLLPEAVVVSVCDQPFLHAHHISSLVKQFRLHKSPYVASAYNGTLGPPALFAPSFFDRLLAIDDASGAKKLFNGTGERIPFPEGSIDIDTEEDYRKAIDGSSNFKE